MPLDPRNIGPGQEQHEAFQIPANRYIGDDRGRRVQYDFRDQDGELFSTTARTLDQARARRDRWLDVKHGVSATAVAASENTGLRIEKAQERLACANKHLESAMNQTVNARKDLECLQMVLRAGGYDTWPAERAAEELLQREHSIGFAMDHRPDYQALLDIKKKPATEENPGALRNPNIQEDPKNSDNQQDRNRGPGVAGAPGGSSDEKAGSPDN